MKNDLSITQQYILETVALSPITNIKEYALAFNIDYTTATRNIKTLLDQQYLIKEDETICINSNKPFPKLFDIKGHNDYIKLLETALINNNFTSESELTILRDHMIKAVF